MSKHRILAGSARCVEPVPGRVRSAVLVLAAGAAVMVLSACSGGASGVPVAGALAPSGGPLASASQSGSGGNGNGAINNGGSNGGDVNSGGTGVAGVGSGSSGAGNSGTGNGGAAANSGGAGNGGAAAGDGGAGNGGAAANNGGQVTDNGGGNGAQPPDQASALQADTTSMTMTQAAVAWVTAFDYGDAKGLVAVSCHADIVVYLKQGAIPSNYNGGIILDVGKVTPNGTHGWVEIKRGGSSSNGVVTTSTALMVQQHGWKFCFTSGDPNHA